MKISVIVEQKTRRADGKAFSAVCAKGKYLSELEEVKSNKDFSEDATYNIRFTQSTPVAIPTAEGIYEVEIPSSASAWIVRNMNAEPTWRKVVCIKSMDECPKFRLKANLRKRESASSAFGE